MIIRDTYSFIRRSSKVDCRSEDMIGTLTGMNGNVEERDRGCRWFSLGISGGCPLPGVLSICFKKHFEQRMIPGCFDKCMIRDGGVIMMWREAM